MGELKTTGRQIHRGGQHVGTPPQVMRVEWIEDGQPMVAVEMYVGGNQSQHKAKQAAEAVIDMLLAELRHSPCSDPSPPSPGAITGIRKAADPCSDCIDGWCQMNCGPRVG
jgi:hypothetical protein